VLVGGGDVKEKIHIDLDVDTIKGTLDGSPSTRKNEGRGGGGGTLTGILF